MFTTWYGDDSPHLSWKCAQVTGKAFSKRVNIQVLGEQLTLGKTVGSRLWWHTHDFGELRLDLGRKPSAQEDGSGVAIDWVTGQSCSSAMKAVRRLNVQSGLREGDKEPENWSERGRP